MSSAIDAYLSGFVFPAKRRPAWYRYVRMTRESYILQSMVILIPLKVFLFVGGPTNVYHCTTTECWESSMSVIF